MRKSTIIFAALSLFVASMEAQESDCKHWSIDAESFAGGIIPHSEDVKKALQSKYSGIYAIGFGYQTLPSDSSIFASDYDYPLFGLRFSITDFSHVKLKEGSRLGNIYTLYGRMERSLLRTHRCLFDYLLDAGLAYATSPHDWLTNPSNPFIGSRLIVYVGFGLGVSYKVSSNVEMGINTGFRHYSSGRLGMPNSGINLFGAFLSGRYYFDARPQFFHKLPKPEFAKEWNFHIYAGNGWQTSLQEWRMDLKANNETCRSHYKLRPKFFLSTDAMYRYTHKFSTGLGMDLFYTGHTGLLRQWDSVLYSEQDMESRKYSKLAVGIAVNQEIYYNNFSINVSFGYYLFRQVGIHDEERFYQRAGFRHYFPKLNNMFMGIAIKAHRFSQAEYLELSVGIKFV